MRYNSRVEKLIEATSAVLKGVRGKKIAVGVSGGRDSVCLLHAVIACGAVDIADVIAVHVNHGLRDEADSDEAFVKAFCAERGVRFAAFKVDVKRESKSKGLTIEQAARNLRYAVFDGLLSSGEADIILTAHHALDNAESVLMHIFRGSGIDGLCGMNSGRIVRPLLSVYPEEIELYAKRNGLKYVTDKTNFELDADRNFIRLQVIPLIEQRYPCAVRAVNALSEESARIKEYLDCGIDPSLISKDGGAVVLSERAFDTALAERYVRKAVSEFTLTDITRSMINSVISLAKNRSGAKAELSCGVIAERESGAVSFYIPRRKFDGEKQIELGANYIDGLAVDVEPTDTVPTDGKKRAVDLDAIDGAVLRFRRDGDTFTPFGGGRKKLKQYLIDKKIPRRLRDRIPLVCRGGEVLAVVGVEISEMAKVTENTTRKATVALRW